MTTAAPSVLEASTGSLWLTLDEQGVAEWCQVQLVEDGVARRLGAESRPSIANRLAAFLAADPAPGQHWVLSLAELHTTFYGELAARRRFVCLHGAAESCPGA